MNKMTTTPVADAVAEIGSPSAKPMFLSDQFEAYLDVSEMELDGRTQRLVSLRSLHEKLGVKRQFTQWVKDALTNSRSAEGVHFSQVTRDLTVPHSSGGTQRVKQHDYYACFEKTKIIAARSDAENSLDICEWLVRVEDQVRADHAAPATTLALPRDYASALRALADKHEALQLAQSRLEETEATLAASVLVPRPRYEENVVEGIALQNIKRTIAPYLSVKVIAHVLKYYGQKRTFVQFGQHENAVVKPFARAGVEQAISQFLEEAERRISFSRKSVVMKHDCLLGDEAQVSREDAIEHLGYAEEDFVD